MHGVWYHDGIGVEFNHNIIERKLKCYRVISEKAETNMPTAYDVDAVVKQLENERKFWENAYDSNLGKEKARSYEHAIEIVKGGGVDV